MRNSVILSLILCWITPSAYAGIIYEIGFDRDAYDVETSGEQAVKVIFREIVDGTGTPRLASGGLKGLFAAGFELDYSVSTGVSGGASFVSSSLNTSLFSLPFTTIVNNESQSHLQLDAQAVDIDQGIEAVPYMRNFRSIYEVEIVTLTFRNNNLPNQVSTLTLRPSEIPFANLFTDGIEVPDIQFQNAQFGSITTVPEPSSMVLLALSLPSLALFRHRFGRGSKPTGKESTPIRD
ncbi:PEP-CTERM sorting domain-containing protein [Pirellulaceae bacterium SH467]|jgi:hypothetical protein